MNTCLNKSSALSATYRVLLTVGSLILSTIALSNCAWADPAEHILEVGLGVGGQYLPEYRGDSGHRLVALPLPLVGYQGKILKTDEDGVRGEFVKEPRFELNVSGDTALSDGKNQAARREGMPDLGTELQIGPSFNFLLAGDSFKSGLMLRLPVRAVYAFEDDYSSISAQGFVFNPMLTYIKPNLFHGWRATLDVGALYATEKYHRHYYTVTAEYATATRPVYEAKGGFSGTFLEFGLSRRTGNYMYGFGLRYDRLSSATFSDSPLVETNDHWSLGFTFGYVIKKWVIREPERTKPASN